LNKSNIYTNFPIVGDELIFRHEIGGNKRTVSVGKFLSKERPVHKFLSYSKTYL